MTEPENQPNQTMIKTMEKPTDTTNTATAQALTTPSGSEPTAGNLYMVNCRFGRATVFVKRVDETWATCEVRSGTLRGMGRGAVWGEGDEKPLRIESARWTLVQNSPVHTSEERG